MKVAFATWRDRISPVFDAARMLTIVEIENGKVIEKSYKTLCAESPFSLAAKLPGWDVRVLICGAITVEFAGLIEMRGIRIIPFVTGELKQVLEAYLNGSLETPSFQMPGYRRRRRGRFRS